MTVVGIENIYDAGIVLTFTVNNDTLQIDFSFINVMVQHHEGKEVVGRTAEVCIENHADGG